MRFRNLAIALFLPILALGQDGADAVVRTSKVSFYLARYGVPDANPASIQPVLNFVNKLDAKRYYHHTGWVGTLNSVTARELLETKPEEVIRSAVRGMLPKSRLGRAMLKKLKVHAGACPAHGYVAQKAEPLELGK